jgi:ubiquinone/menaquinone biosynthesis C-methylase UbiE
MSGGAGHGRLVDRAFTAQASTFNSSAIANADEILDAIVEHGAPRPGERWLEAACGPGIIARRLAPLVGSVHGIDLTPAMIDLARREAALAGLAEVTFEVGDATATDLESASFDGAVTRFSIHHLPVPGRLFAELARVVRPGGRVVVVDHLADEAVHARAWSQEIERLRDPSHWACQDADQLRALGERAGLALEREQRVGFELDFDDWLRRGTDDPTARELVHLALADPPAGGECFAVRAGASGRVLRLQMWLGVWRRA